MASVPRLENGDGLFVTKELPNQGILSKPVHTMVISNRTAVVLPGSKVHPNLDLVFDPEKRWIGFTLCEEVDVVEISSLALTLETWLNRRFSRRMREVHILEHLCNGGDHGVEVEVGKTYEIRDLMSPRSVLEVSFVTNKDKARRHFSV